MAPRIGHIYRPIAERLADKFIPEPNSGCWLWTGANNGVGYGRIAVHGGQAYAHRVSYELHRGPIPDGMHLDHLCRTPCCVNPDHLEPVTNRENARRGALSALRPSRSECKRGHDLSVNRYTDSQGHEQCRKCLRIRQRAYYRRKKHGVHA